MESRSQEHAREGAPHAGSVAARKELAEFGLAEAANDTRISRLARAIEQEIIPRLMLAHRMPIETRAVEPEASRHCFDSGDIRHFAKVVLASDDHATLSAIQAHRSAGASTEAIYVNLLAPTARYLGELWEEDLCTFTDVTIGLGRLQRILRELSPGLGSVGRQGSASSRRVLLLPGPGEQHTLGLVMVGEFFRRAGWNVSGGAWTSDVDPARLVEAERFDVVGFSLGAEVHLRDLAESIRAVRQASCNREIAVLVGGPLFGANPDYAERVGADGMTIDGKEAPFLAERLVARGREASAVPGR